MKYFKIGLMGLILVVLNCFDVVTTFICMKYAYGLEANPWVILNPTQALIKMGISFMVIIISILLEYQAKKEGKFTLVKGLKYLIFGLDLYYLFIVLNNVGVILQGLGILR